MKFDLDKVEPWIFILTFLWSTNPHHQCLMNASASLVILNLSTLPSIYLLHLPFYGSILLVCYSIVIMFYLYSCVCIYVCNVCTAYKQNYVNTNMSIYIYTPIGSMGLVYSPTFTIKINHSCRWIYQSHGSYILWDIPFLGTNISPKHSQSWVDDLLNFPFGGIC